MKEMKRVISLLLCLVMLLGVLPVGALAEEMAGTETTAPVVEEADTVELTVEDETAAETLDADSTSSTIIAMSDYQNSSLSSDAKKTVPQTIVNAMVSAGVSPELVLLGGDYVDGSVGADGSDTSADEMATEFANLTNIIKSGWSSITDDKILAIQGNHDAAQFLTDGTLDATGAYEYDNYIVYLINEDDFPWWQGNYGSGSSTSEDKATVTATANALSAYLAGLDGSKPVIIMSHVPMHWSVRSTSTAWYYDNIYANILFEAINEAAEELDILFLFGHNHSVTAAGTSAGGYDVEIGGALSYVAKGESMKVPNGTDGTSNYTTETLNFTYMNAGYVGKYNDETANCSISAITIDDDSIDIARYTYSGTVYNETIALTGGSGSSDDSGSNDNTDEGNGDDSTSSGNTGDTTTGSWVTIPGSSASEGGLQQVTSLSDISSTDKYIVVVWRYFGNNPNEEGYVFHDENNGDIKVTTSDGYATITSASGTIDDGCYWYITNNGNGTVTMQNVGNSKYLGSNIVANSSSAVSLNIASATYSGYQNFAIGYNDGAIRYSNSSSSFSFSSNSTSSGASSANACNITLYKQAEASEETPDTYARLTGETVQTYDVTDSKTEANILSGLTIETSADGVNADENTVAVTSDMVTWDKTFSGTTIGTYVGTIKYEGQTLGTVTVNISGTAEEVTGNGDWIKVADATGGTTTYTYTQATSITAGEKYVIVGNDNDVALMDNNGSMGSQSVTISGTTMTSTTALTEWTFSGSSSGTIYNGTRYLRYNNGSFSLSANNSTNFTFTDNGSNFRIQSGNYSFYYSGSSWTRSGRNSAEHVRLYQLTDTTTTGGTPETYARLTGTVEQVYSNADNTSLDTILGKVSIQTSTDQSTVASTVDVTSSMVTWDTTFDGNTAGVYNGTVTYEGQTLGTIKVTITPISVTDIELVTAEGSVTKGSGSTAVTGGKLKVTYSDGSTKEVDITLGMLSGDFNSKAEGTYENLTVTYGGKSLDGFTLTVTPKSGNNYPSYPNEGAVKVDKTATGVNFQETGVARVELSASGVPMNQGVDVVVVLDTSSSMTNNITLNNATTTRLAVLRPAVNSLITQLQTTENTSGDPNIDISIVAFNGFTGDGNSSQTYGNGTYDDKNYIDNNAYATPNAGGWLTDTSGDGWVDIMDLSTTWATENDGANITTGSGTNYDEALLMAYELLEAKQAQNAANGETRTQYVVFMSDGAPYQYNGVYSNYVAKNWMDWILGNYETEDDIPDTVTNKEYYTGYAAGQGQDHRIAEAIKGDANTEYQIIKTTADTNGSSYMENVYGLGATMYSIGFILKDDEVITAEQQGIVLKNIASSDDLYYDVDTADELASAFDDIVSAVKLAAYDASFVDTMGAAYDIQLASSVTRSDDEGITLAETPTMEVRSYSIWTRAEYLLGSCTEDQIGKRKTDSDGNYIYTVIETVTFNDAGTEAYTGGDTTNNILVDGVICANNFWYNTNATAVDIDTDGDGTTDYSLPAETFYWKLGDIKTTELALSYYVYLTDSMEGEREAGSYPTNESAILYYTNYLDNSCQKATVSPVLAWDAANVSFAFYLVDKDGHPVNMDGTVVTFANRVTIVNPTLYGEILLNSTGDVDSLEIAADSDILPANYALYDYSAHYKVTINSDGTGGWTITVGDGLNKTTYVTDYSTTEQYTNITSTNSETYDYTHTTVWFAVKWEPQALSDTVVIDYGLPVDIHVLTNDMFGNFGKLVGVTNGDVTEDATKAKNSVATTEAKGEYGSAQVIVPTTGATDENSVVRYTPADMEMYGYDVFTYSVQYTNTELTENNGYYYSTVTVIPATTIYYEDDFVDLSSYTWDYDQDKWKSVAEGEPAWVWKQVTDDTYVENADITQDEDRPGNVNYAFDTVIDANNVYGYDSAYTECSEYSLGSAMMAHVDYDNYAEASFSFYGTGFDVISLTSNTTGGIVVKVMDKDKNVVRNTTVDTYYGYTQDENGNWVTEPNNPNALYQVPVMEISGLEYGKYSVVIKAYYSTLYDHQQYTDDKAESYDFYLDAIRIYDPANDGASDGSTDTTIEDAYEADNEGWPVYEELRNNVIDAATLESESGETEIAGIVFIDSVDETASVSDYISYGPNNELYLASGQAIVFNLDLDGYSVAFVQLGIKSATENTPVSYKIFDGEAVTTETALDAVAEKTLSTSTGMYYDITSLKDKTIVIYNSGSNGMLSLTDIKITFTADPGEIEKLFYVKSSTVEAVVENMNKETAETTPTEPVKFEVSVPASVTVGNTITVTVTTSEDVAAVSVDGEAITNYSTNAAGERIWTAKISTNAVGTKEIKVDAFDSNGKVSSTQTVEVTVENSTENVIRTIISKLKKWFGW